MRFVNIGGNGTDGSETNNDARIHNDVKHDIRILDNMHEAAFSASNQIAKEGVANKTLSEIRNDLDVAIMLAPEFPASLTVFIAAGTAIARVIAVVRKSLMPR